jgi:uncharacterized membrane protein
MRYDPSKYVVHIINASLFLVLACIWLNNIWIQKKIPRLEEKVTLDTSTLFTQQHWTYH